MKIKVSLEIIHSRFNRGWYEVVLTVDDESLKYYGQFKTREEAKDFKETLKIKICQ